MPFFTFEGVRKIFSFSWQNKQFSADSSHIIRVVSFMSLLGLDQLVHCNGEDFYLENSRGSKA